MLEESASGSKVSYEVSVDAAEINFSEETAEEEAKATTPAETYHAEALVFGQELKYKSTLFFFHERKMKKKITAADIGEIKKEHGVKCAAIIHFSAALEK